MSGTAPHERSAKPVGLAERGARALGHQDRGAEVARLHLEARGLVHRVADDGVGDALAGADVAGDHVAGADADAGHEPLAAGRRSASASARCSATAARDRPPRVVGIRLERPAEDDDDAVAEELRDDAALALADALDDRVVLVQQLDDARRRQADA